MQPLAQLWHWIAQALVSVLLGVGLVSAPAAQPGATAPVASSTQAARVSTSTPARAAAPTTPAPKPIAKTHTAPTPTSTGEEYVWQAPAVPPVDPTLLNKAARAALVNILCTSGGTVHPISGSGIFIDNRGVVLTNAHVAQYFLLRDYPTPGNVDCLVRTGSPAEPAYHATLLYLPPAWISANASQINLQQATGTGENDYAFLLVVGAVGSGSLPSSFPAVPVTLDDPLLGEPVFLAAYPAGFLSGLVIENNLYASTANSTVDAIYTFGTQTIDVVDVGGSVIAQAGSSGGGVLRAQDGALTALVATVSEATSTAERNLRGITMAHINRSLAAAGKGGLVDLLSGDLQAKADDFNTNTAPTLTQELEAVLKQ